MDEINNLKAAYLIDQIRNSINPHMKGVVFHFPLIGLHELTRQYFSLPNEIKFLAGPQIIDSIKDHIKKTKIITSVKNGNIVDKNVKQYATNLSYLKEIGGENAIRKLHITLHDDNFYKGIVRSIKKLLKTDTYDLIMCYKIFDELLVLLIEFLYSRGHSKEAIYAKVNNIISQVKENPLNTANKILDHLMSIGTQSFDSMDKMNVKVVITKESSFSNYKFLFSLVEDHLQHLRESNRISEYDNSHTADIIEYQFSIFKIDKEYVDEQLSNLAAKFNLLSNRLNLDKNNVSIFLNNRLIKPIGVPTDTKMNIKYFDEFLSKNNFSNLSPITKLEILKILEWTNYPETTLDKKFNFMSLWGIMEFLLIDSVEDNKLDTIINNFTPYMTLFHFRKSIKLLYKDIIYQMKKDLSIASIEFEKYLDTELTKINVDINSLSIVDKFTIFIFTKKLKPEEKWLYFNDSSVDKNLLVAKTITLGIDLDKQIEQFENSLKNDIKQIYRLRNMLTHSGENDQKILEDTFYRLKYYVQTLLNSISYSWLYNKEIEHLTELHELKRFDSIQFKDFVKGINKGRDENRWTNLCDFKALLVSVPKSSFSFFSKSKS